MESKTVKSKQRKYDADFKKEVIKMVEAGRSVPDVSGVRMCSLSLPL
jgi:hypothetical protein